MLRDWNAGTPQHNIVWSLELGSEWHLFQAVQNGSSNTLLLSTFSGYRTMQLRICCFQTQAAKVFTVSAVTSLH